MARKIYYAQDSVAGGLRNTTSQQPTNNTASSNLFADMALYPYNNRMLANEARWYYDASGNIKIVNSDGTISYMNRDGEQISEADFDENTSKLDGGYIHNFYTANGGQNSYSADVYLNIDENEDLGNILYSETTLGPNGLVMHVNPVAQDTSIYLNDARLINGTPLYYNAKNQIYKGATSQKRGGKMFKNGGRITNYATFFK